MLLGNGESAWEILNNITELTQPLLSSKHAWTWDTDQETAFPQVKPKLFKSTVLAFYDPAAETSWQLFFWVGCSTDAEAQFHLEDNSICLQTPHRNWVQVEKEALACTWASKKVSDHALERNFVLETNHKPLVSLLSSNHLDDLPPRILRFHLHLSKFTYQIQHVPVKLLYTADHTSFQSSRLHLGSLGSQDIFSRCWVLCWCYCSSTTCFKGTFCGYQAAQVDDPICQQVIWFSKRCSS